MEERSLDERRPLSVVAFEVLNIASAVIYFALGEAENIWGNLFTLGLSIAVTLWITRGRSRTARIVYTSIMALAVTALLGAYHYGYLPDDEMPWLIFRFSLEIGVCLALLWWPSTSAWLRKGRKHAAA